MENLLAQGILNSWIQGPYKQIAIMFATLYLLIGGLSLAIGYIPKFIERKRADARWAKDKELL